MSEGDRAAKAARAKAMLKKRQREKAGGISSIEPPITQARALSPAPLGVVQEDKRDLSSVFNKDDTLDTSWLSSLPRAATPPPRPTSIASPPPAPSTEASPLQLDAENASSADEVKRLQVLETQLKQAEISLRDQRASVQRLQEQLRQLEIEKENALRNEERTISLLVTEKSSLTAELQRLEGVDSKFHDLENVLEEEHCKLKSLEERFHQREKDTQESTKIAYESQRREKELSERLREKERELQLTSSSISDFKQGVEQYQRRLRDLEEQIQNDDRIGRLEGSLKNTQERADELEFQLTKLKQAHSTLKIERDEIEARRLEHFRCQSDLEAKHSDLQRLHLAAQQELATFASEKDSLAREKSNLQNQVDSTQRTLTQVQEKFAQAAAIIASNTRQLQAAQNDLKLATRRAEDAEKIQQDLQAEGTSLMRSLDEMRSKAVELTGVKLELTEKVCFLELELRNSGESATQLETALHGATERREELNRGIRELLSEREKERAQMLADSSELQKAYDELQEELDSANASLHNLEAERSSHHQDTTRRLEEIERLDSSSRAKSEELSALHQELDAMIDAQNEGQEFLERAQNEIEALRAELSARENEIERLREVASSPTPSGETPQSLDDELLSSIRQQHALELSAAHSQIRALESSVFDANARTHSLQKQVSTLEAQLSRSRPPSRLGQRSFSPAARPPSRTHSDIRRSSIGSYHRPPSNFGAPPPLARTIFDQNMSVETRHKRLVSLSMLKARIDSEVEVTLTRPSSRASSVRASSPVLSETGSRQGATYNHAHYHSGHRPQFLDDSHVFWCHSCSGDLVIL